MKHDGELTDLCFYRQMKCVCVCVCPLCEELFCVSHYSGGRGFCLWGKEELDSSGEKGCVRTFLDIVSSNISMLMLK